MVIPAFSLARIPRTIFEVRGIDKLPGLIRSFGRSVLLVTGTRSFRGTPAFEKLEQELRENGLIHYVAPVPHEPTPDLVDKIVAALAPRNIDVVVAVGGGSALDAGKAVAAMLPLQQPVKDYLEGVGSGKEHPGVKLPMIAVPTTAGTGTEATKNASLRQVGERGFKNSLRHDNFVPDVALIDPALACGCPPSITAQSGMDAFAQLLESYVSPKATPVTDALAISGLEALREGLLPAFHDGADLHARSHMAYAAYVSGITLANAGLGMVHSLSSAIGGLFDIPHGVICGTLLGPGTAVNIENLRIQKDGHALALQKHARLGSLLCQKDFTDDDSACDALLELIERWSRNLGIPRLSAFGMTHDQLDGILDKAALRNNPVALSREDIRKILVQRLD